MKKILIFMLVFMTVSVGVLFADGEIDAAEFNALIPVTAAGMVLAISTFMHGLKAWWDSQDKLKKYWTVFAVVFSFLGSTIISMITGFDWTATGSYMAWVAQVLTIYGGQHLFEQAWFKKWWPTIKEVIPLFLKWILKR